MKLYVRYCGGCNPTFDRCAVAERAAEALGAALCYDAAPGGQPTLCISGCARGCARQAGRHSVHIHQQLDPGEVKRMMQALGTGKEYDDDEASKEGHCRAGRAPNQER